MYKKIKRLLDIILSLTGLIILSPLLMLVAVAIKLESKGPIIFQQERLGLNGRVFKIYKFRSMCIGAEKSGVYETKGDTRVTKVGKFIRKTSIDEFPQFINILKGDMSIIGPRPTLTYHPWTLKEYTTEQKKRFNVRPGVTGWAQVNGRKDVPWDKRIEYDVEYVNSLSLIFDIKIFFKTIFKVLTMQDNINVGETAKSNRSDIKK
ncbi:TPA: sugar transferase [Bacillus cereus]|nr:sugar transferase [Bacillus cereus]